MLQGHGKTETAQNGKSEVRSWRGHDKSKHKRPRAGRTRGHAAAQLPPSPTPPRPISQLLPDSPRPATVPPGQARLGPAWCYLERQVVDAAQAGHGQQLHECQEREQAEAARHWSAAGARRADGCRGSHVCSSITSCFLSRPLPGSKVGGRRKGLSSRGDAVDIFARFSGALGPGTSPRAPSAGRSCRVDSRGYPEDVMMDARPRGHLPAVAMTTRDRGPPSSPHP